MKKNSPLPLYKVEDLKSLTYYAGKYGTSCRELMTVLLPGMCCEVLSENKEGVCKVLWLRNKNREKCCEGYVHRNLLKKQCEPVAKDIVNYVRSPMSLKDIRAFYEECSKNTICYGWGGNWKDEIKLPKDYIFTQRSEEPGEEIKYPGKPYRCCGIDCCGLVYLPANGILRRTCKGIRNHGKHLWSVNKENCDIITREKLEVKLDELNLRDTDIMVLGGNAGFSKGESGHLATWYNGGILEFRGVDYGCEYRKKKDEILDRIMRWVGFVKESDDEDYDLRFIRWHPELLTKEEFEEYFPQE